MSSTILVTDGEQRSALAIVRSLGRAGYAPVVCSANGRSLAGASRYCGADDPVPDPLRHTAEYRERLLQICRDRRPVCLIPTTDEANEAILPVRWQFHGLEVLGPEAESFAKISDKWALAAVARNLGIAVPKATRIESVTDVPHAGLHDFAFPVVIKPTRSITGELGYRVRTSVSYARTAEEAVSILSSAPAQSFPFMVQEKIEGPGVGLFLLRWDGATLAAFSHRRLREKPPSGGVSVYRESIPVDDDLLRRCEDLLAVHDWRGVAMVEFKICERTRLPHLLEVNGRFWGSLQLAIDAGVDFPSLLVSAALGKRVSRPPSYRIGVKCRWFWGDVDHAIALTRNRSGTGRRDLFLAVLRLFRLPRRHDRLEVLRARDLRPFLRESALWIRSALARGRSSPRSPAGRGTGDGLTDDYLNRVPVEGEG